jgi:hypothetical protein
MGYYFVDDMYHVWSTLVKTIWKPNDKKEVGFAKGQDAYRKDIERAFGVCFKVGL